MRPISDGLRNCSAALGIAVLLLATPFSLATNTDCDGLDVDGGGYTCTALSVADMIPDISADKDQLIQAILNIVRNADQATHENGEIMIKTRINRQSSMSRTRNKLSVKIDIIDNGQGIKPEMLNQIFYPIEYNEFFPLIHQY